MRPRIKLISEAQPPYFHSLSKLLPRDSRINLSYLGIALPKVGLPSFRLNCGEMSSRESISSTTVIVKKNSHTIVLRRQGF